MRYAPVKYPPVEKSLMPVTAIVSIIKEIRASDTER
jgi:hypothetical protein